MSQRKGLIRRVLERKELNRQVRLQKQKIPERFKRIPREVEEALKQQAKK